MDLKLVVKRLEEFAPLNTATDWDNVGLLVEPSDSLTVTKILVTNDLSEPVIEEAKKKNVNLIVSYHPAINPYKGLKRLTQTCWKERKIIKCLESRIAVFSPHTTWDSIDGGINDFILEAFDTTKIVSVREIKSNVDLTGFSKTVKINLESGQHKEKIFNKLSSLSENIKFVGQRDSEASSLIELEFLASKQGVVSFIEIVTSSFGALALNTLRIYDLDRPLLKNVGLGRIGTLKEPIKIRDIVSKLKTILGMKTFRLALANGKSLDDTAKVIAVGAGTSTNLLNNVNADFIITGEISHHEIMHEIHRGVSLIVTDHSNTERCYINAFIQRFNELLKKHNDPSLELIKSEVDRDPLEYI